MIRILPLIALTAIALPLGARRTNTQPSKRPKVKVEHKSPSIKPDTSHIAVARGEFEVTGYDKPLRSRHESMLVTNHTDADADSLCITLEYSDLQGRQLHHRSLWAKGDVPAGETRMVVIPSWDVQCSYVYRHSSKPRALHTPYDVVVSIDSIKSKPF